MSRNHADADLAYMKLGLGAGLAAKDRRTSNPREDFRGLAPARSFQSGV
jgi:hypothetical protein